MHRAKTEAAGSMTDVEESRFSMRVLRKRVEKSWMKLQLRRHIDDAITFANVHGQSITAPRRRNRRGNRFCRRK